MTNHSSKTILIAPLDWGLGHATRCISIIQTLQNQGFKIIVAVNKKQQQLLEQEIKNVRFVFLQGYEISYSKTKYFFGLKIVAQAPKILWRIYQEHQWLKKTIADEKIDIVISDNRFGLFNKKIPSVFITHQLQIKAPFVWLEGLIQKINYRFINHYQQCWVPDVEGENNIAGNLSHPKILPKTPTHYIGCLSRFKRTSNSIKLYDVCILLSGPEPQRTLFEQILLHQIKSIKHKKIIFVRGLPSEENEIKNDSIVIYNHLTHQELEEVINTSELIIARSGYTTVMELMNLHKKSILIPTSGQTEQEYLAQHLSQKKHCLSYTQNNFDLEKALKEADSYKYNFIENINFKPHQIPELINKLAD